MLRYSRERLEQEIAYVKDMGLNTIRLEGKLEDEPFFDITDREGILVMPGWCCCDHWEHWKDWDAEDLTVATASLRDQILRLRGRASVFTWLNGSDNPPPAKVEKAYLDVLQRARFPEPDRLLRHREEGRGHRRERGEDARALRVGAAALLVHRHQARRPARLRDRDRAGTGAAAAREPEALHPRGRAVADRRGLALPLRRRPVPDTRRVHCCDGRALRPFEGRRGVREEGAGRRLRVAPRHARVVRRAQVRRDRRHPVDAQQRLAGDDLAPLRLLPSAGRLVLRRQEGGRAAARAVRLRRPLGRGRQLEPAGPRRPRGARARSGPRVEDALREERSRGRGARRQRQGVPGPGASRAHAHVVPVPEPRRRERAHASAATSTGSRPGPTSSPGTSPTGTHTPVAHYADLTGLEQLPKAELRARRASRRVARASRSRTRPSASRSSSTSPFARARRARRCCRCCGTTTT